jgi:ketosteroid isomerase-like protein
VSDAFLGRLFGAIDAKDTDGFVACLTDDCSFRFGSAPTVHGHEAIAAAVSGFFDSIAGLNHALHRTIVDGPALAVDGDVTYTRHDGRHVTVPFANVFELQGDRIGDYRIYIDLGPLYAD